MRVKFYPVSPVTDELLDKLSIYYLYHEVKRTHDLDFHEFVELVINRRWENFV